MLGSAWTFSAKLAWQRRHWRALTGVTVIVWTIASAVFLWKLIPLGLHQGTLVLHTNVYLGIDEVQPWPVVFLLPAVWLCVTALELILAYGAYRHDRQLATALLVVACGWGFAWVGGLFYLLLANL